MIEAWPSDAVAQTVSARHVRDVLSLWLLDSATTLDSPPPRLPSEDYLAATFGTSRSTVREAISLLSEGGLITRRRGVGTTWFGTRPVLHMDPAATGVSVQRWEAEHEVLAWEELPLTPTTVARKLGRPANEGCLLVEMVMRVSDGQGILSSTYVRTPEHQALSEKFRAEGTSLDWFSALKDVGAEVKGLETTFRAALADEVDEQLLGVPLGSSLVISEGTFTNPQGEVTGFYTSRGRASFHVGRFDATHSDR